MRVLDHSNEELTLLQVHLGGDRNWQYLIADPATGDACAVDPGHAPRELADLAQRRGVAIRVILITHGHGDHTGGAVELAALTRAAVRAGRAGVVPGATVVHDGETIAVGRLRIQALLTPGHAPDHVAYRCGDALLTGDLLFCGKVGGTGPSFAGSSAAAEWASLKRILTLPDDVRIFPGHDYYGGLGELPASTVGHERRHNPFLLCADLAAFEHLKATWVEYKKEHGIR
ncbi:MAG TPA: hydroxyacylglutathione hydrolase family protein [Candidatus Krumholzibacteria bacterium]|nr:hydroxyacylglutathione hydrolase family protein [Candidatus Krumholzibacteria bacterium]HPD72004.1 hydroxyacylglutathione hydrolase family protein [Candidatus Krumholzibacteria bacterium]HRY41063.1 hydroxyacylglutathione hydrolase family protein [Candidatus Krumholzibacteria bacterium]